MRPRTFKILRWEERPKLTLTLELCCPNCGWWANLDVGPIDGLVIGNIGLAVIFDPPGHRPARSFMPNEIQCRMCRAIFTDREE